MFLKMVNKLHNFILLFLYFKEKKCVFCVCVRESERNRKNREREQFFDWVYFIYLNKAGCLISWATPGTSPSLAS